MKYETKISFEFENTMSIMIHEIKKGSTVLEFGPASGRLTKYLKEEMNCQVYIVEIDEEAGKIASQYAMDYVIGNIEDYEWIEKFKGIQFDYILFADVLEHLFHSEEVLAKSISVLKPEGYIIMSLPNIAHNSIIINLIQNKFEYKNTGLLDHTHVRFWTYDNIENMLKNLKLNVDVKYATYTQVGFNEFDNTYEELRGINPLALKSRKMAEVYQFVYKVTPSKKAREIDKINYYTDYYYTQYFYDGANDERIVIVPDGREHEFDIEIKDGTKKLRFDPLNKKCIIRIEEVMGSKSGEEKEKEVSIESSNAIFAYENTYYFDHDDSQMYFIVEGLTQFHIKYTVVDCDRIDNEESIKKLMQICDDRRIIIEQKESYICDQRDMLSEKDKNYQDLLQEKDEQIKKLKNQLRELQSYKNFVTKVKPVGLLYKMEKKVNGSNKNKEKANNNKK